MYIIAWQFDVKPEHASRFEEVYGSDGEWAQLFGRSPEYRGTELFRDVAVAHRYLTLDAWTSEQAFTAFALEHAAEYAALDAASEALTTSERLLGAFGRAG